MVFGGSGSGDLGDDTTEVINTLTMTSTPGPDMLTGRSGCAAVYIDADRVLVVAGWSAEGEDAVSILNTTEIFHLATNTFTPGPDMQSARNCAAAVALDARRIIVFGGDNGGGSFLSSTEILSMDTMTFAPGPSMATSRAGCAAVALDEHRILVAGGESGSGYLNTTEVLDVRTMAFAPGPSMSSERDGCAAVPVDAQHVLIIGGQDSSDTALAMTELLDVSTMEFVAGPTMQIARQGCGATRFDVAGGQQPQILVVGGDYDAEAEILSVVPGASTRRRL